jgi:hypothetical protein
MMTFDGNPNDPIQGSILQMRKMLGNLDRWLEKASIYATSKAFDPRILVLARLAPDQIPLVRQVQNACDRAKFAAARVTGVSAPRHADVEQTVLELHARIGACSSYLDGFRAADFAGAHDRLVDIPFLDGKAMRAADYVRELALPAFYFHVTTAYAILRHNGVDLSMRDFIGATQLLDQ